MPHGPPSWLSNSSFSENLLPPPPSSLVSTNEHMRGRDVLDEIEGRRGKVLGSEGGRVEAGFQAASLISDVDFSREPDGETSRQRKQKEKRHRKRNEEKEVLKRRKNRKKTGDELQIGSLEVQSVDRKAVMKAWADGKVNVTEEYYVDTRGDRDNLAFCSLYRMDVARFFRQHIDGGVKEDPRKRYATYFGVVEPEGGVQENKGCRYWSGEAMALELKRDFRRIRVWPLIPSASTVVNHQKHDAFIPLESSEFNKKK